MFVALVRIATNLKVEFYSILQNKRLKNNNRNNRYKNYCSTTILQIGDSHDVVL
jgi:hypothetical protein